MLTRAILLALGTVILAPLAQAALVSAQFDPFANGGSWYIQPFYGNYVIGQTFTATVNGTLVSLDTTIHKSAGTPHPLRFEIRPLRDAGPNGLQPDMRPGAPVLASGTMLPGDPQFSGLISFKQVAMSPMAIEAGQSYGIVVTAPPTSEVYHWYTQSGGAGYPAGRLFVGYQGDTVLAGQTGDVPFRVNVVQAPIAQFDPYTPAGGSGVQQPIYTNQVLAQTFVNPVEGTLESVEATIHRANATTKPLRFEIRAVYDAGAGDIQPDLRPGATPLAVGELPANSPQFDTFMITYKKAAMPPISLNAGQIYALVVSAPETDWAYTWYTTHSGPNYSEGRFLRTWIPGEPLEALSFDAGFRITVTPGFHTSAPMHSRMLNYGAFNLTFTNAHALNITVLASTNVAAPTGQWTAIGTATETSPGQYQFNDSGAPDSPNRVYRLRRQ